MQTEFYLGREKKKKEQKTRKGKQLFTEHRDMPT